MGNKTVIAFDLDDTLYKERDYVFSAYREITRYYGDIVPDDVKEKFFSFAKPYEAFDFLAAAVPGTDVEKMKEIYRSGNVPLADTECALETLTSLKDSGFRVAIITDGFSARQRKKIQSLKLDAVTDCIIISEETGCDKHSPVPFRLLQETFPDASRFCYVGDNPEKDFYHPNIMGWNTAMIFDGKKQNIHSQNNAPTALHKAKTTLMSLKETLKLYHG